MIDTVSLDHLVLTVADSDRTAAFYRTVMGMTLRRFGEGRMALHFGDKKVNLHRARHEFEPQARAPLPGSAGSVLSGARRCDRERRAPQSRTRRHRRRLGQAHRCRRGDRLSVSARHGRQADRTGPPGP